MQFLKEVTRYSLTTCSIAMASLTLLSFLCLFLILISQVTSKPEFRYTDCIGSSNNYTENSTFMTNLDALLSNLTSNTQIDYGFYNLSYGRIPDTVYVVGLCRGDVNQDDCHSCLKNSTVLPQLCPYSKQALGGYDECLLYFVDSPVNNLNFMYYMSSANRATDWDQYQQVLRGLLGNLSSRAASGDSRLKFAAGNEAGPSLQTIYALVQCLPNLDESECNNCLVEALLEITNCCNGKSGGGVVKPSCNFRYESERFYEIAADVPISAPSQQFSPPPPPPPPSSPPATPPSSNNTTSSKGKNKTSQTVIAIGVPIFAFVVLINLIWICVRVRKRRRHLPSEPEPDNEIELAESIQFDFDTIKVVTNNFSDANKLGQGGFGPVYKGRLSNGQKIAVKRLSADSRQGDIEFKNEVLLMAKLQHRNLVRLLGFCLKQKERLLVYEFLPNKSLDYFIFDPVGRAQLGWKMRYKIIEGIARGLLYLHEESQQRIIHRDLKTSNILLDEKMNPKISDFGMARLFVVDQTQANTKKIVGTLGYMAPEYARHGQFSIKSDVFSFGVLILEIVSGHKNGGFRGENVEHLLSFAWKSWRKGTAFNIVDPTIKDGSRNEIMKCIHIALLCVQEKAAKRPTSASIVLMLNSDSSSIPVPLQPAFLMNSRSLSGIQSGRYNAVSTSSSEQKSKSVEIFSENEASITDLYPR